MELYTIISQLPKGEKIKLAQKAKVNRQTVYRAEQRIQCSAETALALASAMGCPGRWPELVVIRKGQK